MKHIAKYVDHMIVIFPFEEEFYREHGVPVTYVGHPLIEQVAGVGRARPSLGQGTTRVVALMPGSRRMEVEALLPPMLDAIRILRQERKIDAFLILAPTIEYEEVDEILKKCGVDLPILPHDRGEGIAAADLALSSSGTATLECAVLGTPVVVMYRLSRATHWLARRLVKLPQFSLVNIIAGKEVVPELLQDEVTGERIAAAVRDLLANRDKVRGELALVRGKLGESGASRRAAEAIMSVVRG